MGHRDVYHLGEVVEYVDPSRVRQQFFGYTYMLKLIVVE